LSRQEILYHKKLLGKIAVATAYQYSFLGKPEIIWNTARSPSKIFQRMIPYGSVGDGMQ
jgi:hypothetical protein